MVDSVVTREHNRQVLERARAYAAEADCFEIPGQPGAVIIVRHPGQPVEILTDHERLLREFGIVDPTKVKKLADSWAAPPAEQSLDHAIAAAEREVERLRAERARHEEIERGIVEQAEAKVDELRAEGAARRGRTT